jgi:hypothetical protein
MKRRSDRARFPSTSMVVIVFLVTILRVEQAVQVDDEITHVGIVDAGCCRTAPSLVGLIVAREDADDVKLTGVRKFDFVRLSQMAAEDQMQQLAMWQERPP